MHTRRGVHVRGGGGGVAMPTLGGEDASAGGRTTERRARLSGRAG
jgi:hypothetical protein